MIFLILIFIYDFLYINLSIITKFCHKIRFICSTMKKNKVLIIFRYPHGYLNSPIIDKFLNYYDTEYIYLNDYKNKNFIETINDVNNLIKLKNIEIVVFDVDYFRFINFFFIEKINCKKKILITADDFDFNEFHSITASACNLVLSACPLSVLKYRQKGYEAHYISFDNAKINKNKIKKIIMTKKIYHVKKNGWTYPITKQLILDGRKNRVLNNNINLKIPITLFHGLNDAVVPLSLSKKILKKFKKAKKRLVRIKNGDHSLSRKKDLKNICSELKKMISCM